jgi:hypothetical protein
VNRGRGTPLQSVRFIETPNGPVVVADTEPQLMMDDVAARRLRTRLSRALGNAPVLLRCQIGSSVSFNGDPGLQRHAVDPMVDAMPSVGIELDPPLREVA